MLLGKASVAVSDSCRVVYHFFFSSLKCCGRDRGLGRGLGCGLGCGDCMDRADGHSCPPHPGPPCVPHPDALHTLHSPLSSSSTGRSTGAAASVPRFSEPPLLRLASLAEKTACWEAIFSALGMSNTPSSRHPLLPIPMFTNTHYCQKPHFSKAMKKTRRYLHLTSTLTTNTPSVQTHISFTIYHLSHVPRLPLPIACKTPSLLPSSIPCQ